MRSKVSFRRPGERRRGVVAVQVAVALVLLLGFAALTVDIGVIYNTRADLQRTADAAALAAAAKLADYSKGDPIPLARQAAVDFVRANHVFGKEMELDLNADVRFGRASFNEETGLYDFTPTESLPDAVRISVRHTKDSPNGSAQLFFARIFGVHDTQISAQATAIMVPRDIALVADLSASHNDDSELSNYPSQDVNLWDVWDAWPGGYDEIDYGVWEPEEIPPEWIEMGGEVPQAAGPAWGFFKKLGFGQQLISQDYDPVVDGGLIRLAYKENWTDATLRQYLSDRGYVEAEVDAMMSSTYDANGAYRYRVAVALGLAYWNSGIPGGLWEQRGAPPGNANAWVGSGEVEWAEPFHERTLDQSASIFYDYINGFMKGTNSRLYATNADFRYRFGVKTFLTYLMERRYDHADTPEWANTPHQPMAAVKDAVGHMVDFIDGLNTDDQLSLEVYGTTGRHEVDLTMDVQDVNDRMSALQAGHYDGWTNMGGGLQRALDELTSGRARHTSKKMIVLLTDGFANVDQYGNTGNEQAGADYARMKAEEAATLGFTIFCVSVGANSNISLMEEIAELGGGEHFHAEGSIEQYSAQLEAIFRELGGRRPVELIE
ncbi:MAG: VWA domain-containing protein [Phycisphaerales bacterium]|nr:MAG: VWA domain-containing protein [Phycisphaerales bacterium]